MLYPTAGARLYIADAPGSAPGPPWVEIGETEALGTLGIEWDTAQVVHSSCTGPAQTLSAKSHLVPVVMQIVLGNDPVDPGQAILWRAARSEQPYPFRLVDASGRQRTWVALVTSLHEVFDSANSIMKLQADLLPEGSITRSGEP